MQGERASSATRLQARSPNHPQESRPSCSAQAPGHARVLIAPDGVHIVNLVNVKVWVAGHGHGRPQGGRDPAKPFHVLPYTCNCTALQYCRTNACSKACAGWLMPSPPRAVRRNPLAPARAARAPPERPAAWHEHSRCEMLGRQPCCAWSKSVRSGGPTRTPLSLCTNPPVLRRLSHNSAARRSRAPPAPSYSLRLCM